MRIVAWDTWAFAEVALRGLFAEDVRDLARRVDDIVTSRDVVAETFTLLSRKLPGRSRDALRWYDGLASGAFRVVDPPLRDVRDIAPRDPGQLSFADLSLARVARDEATREIATGDSEFRALGLDPLFADR